MVDLVVFQSIPYVAAAIGVCLAAVYYTLTQDKPEEHEDPAQHNHLR
jgi:hypothetical protein